jgi:hypothetical protein
LAFRYSGAGWRVAASIRTFGDQIMAARGHTNSYSVDGTLGDLAHSNRTSDHNPDENGIVRALDFYEWTPGVVDQIFETLRLSRDARLKYAIHDGRMFASYVNQAGDPAWTWRTYTGTNPHTTHGHLSVVATDMAEQTHPWALTRSEEDDMWQYVNVDESLVRHAWNEGWLQPKTTATLNYFLSLIPELQKAVSANPDHANFRRAVTNGLLRQKAGSGGFTEAEVRQLASSEILRRLNNG